MAGTIQVTLTERRCELGDAYARQHMTTPPKTAVLSCEGVCLRGDVARRAANLIAHELLPEKAVRICHGGLLESSGGMRELVERADRVLMLDGCGLACGTRLLKAALPEIKPKVVFTNELFNSERAPFGVESVAEERIKAYARAVAKQVVVVELTGQESGPAARTTSSVEGPPQVEPLFSCTPSAPARSERSKGQSPRVVEPPASCGDLAAAPGV